jgi:copper transport protein
MGTVAARFGVLLAATSAALLLGPAVASASIAGGDLAQAAAAEQAAHGWYVVARAVDYLGTALFIGGCVFVALLWPTGSGERRTRWLLGCGWALGLVGTLATLGLEGAWAAGLPPSAAVSMPVIGRILGIPFGRVWISKALVWVLAGVVLADLLQRRATAARSLAWRVGAGAVALGLIRTTGLTGHSTDLGSVWSSLADLAHLTGVTLWIGGLAVLLVGVLPRRRPEDLAAILPGYSRLAMTSVTLIVLAGVFLAWRILGSVHALLHTGYGNVLLIKIGLLALVLMAAWVSKSWVSRRLDFALVLRGDVLTTRPLIYAVTAETVLLVFVVFAASFLVTANPGQ